jgi:branched-chain amino acid transport system ATP-binding protein
MAELRVSGLTAGYGSMQVVNDVGFSVATGEVVSLVGRNGAGKTTTLHATAGLRYGACRGSVLVGDQQVFSHSPSRMPRSGLALVPEGHRVFVGMTVLENLRLGAFPVRSNPDADLASALDRVYDLFPDLAVAKSRPAEQLSGGQQQMLAIGQALMCNPTYLLLDEPCAGLAPTIVDRIYDVIDAMASEGRGVLFVEQDVQRAMRRSQRTYVMDRGSIVLEGASAQLLEDGHVLDLIRGVMEGVDDGRVLHINT